MKLKKVLRGVALVGVAFLLAFPAVRCTEDKAKEDASLVIFETSYLETAKVDEKYIFTGIISDQNLIIKRGMVIGIQEEKKHKKKKKKKEPSWKLDEKYMPEGPLHLQSEGFEILVTVSDPEPSGGDYFIFEREDEDDEEDERFSGFKIGAEVSFIGDIKLINKGDKNVLNIEADSLYGGKGAALKADSASGSKGFVIFLYILGAFLGLFGLFQLKKGLS